MTLLALLAVCVLPIDGEPVRDYTDVVERNWFYDCNGQHCWTQIIWWNWSYSDREYHVVAWRMVKEGQPNPRYDHVRGIYRCVWQDGEVHRCVESYSFRESWSQSDPELADREKLPKHERRELTQVLVDKPSGAIRPPEPAP